MVSERSLLEHDELDRLALLYVELPGVSRVIAVQRPDQRERDEWPVFAELVGQYATPGPRVWARAATS